MKYKRKATQTSGDIKQENVIEMEGEVNEIADLISFLDFMNNSEEYSEGSFPPEDSDEPTKH